MNAPRYYLRQIYAERYGAFSSRELAPFKPGLNVVYGPNEAGKSTYSSLVGGILFGWEDAHGVRNTYHPAEGTPSGMLTFANYREPASDSQPDPALVRITRIGDDFQQSESDKLITSDINAATYRTMFSFSSDELRSLGSSGDVATRLFSAGSGTAASPSSVYVEIEQRIAALTSLSPDATDSVIVLTQQLEEKRAQVQEMAHQVDALKQKDRELRELLSNRDGAQANLTELDRTIEQLTKGSAEIREIDARLREHQQEYVATKREQEAIEQETNDVKDIDARLLELDANEVRVLRDRLDEFEALYEKVTRVEDAAKENSIASTAGYEAILELDQQDSSEKTASKAPRGRVWGTAATVVPTIIFFLAGIALFIYGRRIESLSFTVLSIGLIALSFVLAIAAVVGNRRTARQEDSLESRIKDAQWVMLQDQKRFDSSHAETEELMRRLNEFLEESGLGNAQGSIRHARALLDDSIEVKSQQLQNDQRRAALQLRLETLENEQEQLKATRSQVEARLQLQPGVLTDEIDEILKAKTTQRVALRTVADDTSHRIGQLSQELDAALKDSRFDELKLEAELLRAQLREAKEQLAELLLARRMLERAIVSWESDSQPRVFEEAGNVLKLITDGKWTRVSTSSTGSIVAVSCDGREVKPRHLSLGTCQQLYLALRVALLQTAQDVGKSIPVIADDILVHFDEERRRGAARVLAKLASSRQVIVFTCHPETIEALNVASAELAVDSNYVAL